MRYKIQKINKKIIIASLILLALSGAYAVYAASASLSGGGATNNGLVLDLKLSHGNYSSVTKTFQDNSGNGNNGVSSNVATFSADNNNQSAGAMNFNGTSDYININNSSDLNPGSDMTIAAWVHWNGGSGDNNIITKENAYEIRVNGGYVNYAINPWAWLGGTAAQILPNQWVYVVVTHAGSGLQKIYINGVGKFSTTSGGSVASNANVVTIGARYGGTGSRFNGSISHVQVYNRALSATEVEALYESSQYKISGSSLHSGLIGSWPLNGNNYNPTTGQVTDKTPYGNNGINYGAILTTDRMGEVNGAMSFNGVSSHISISYPNPVKETSVVAWFKRSGSPAGGFHIITGGPNVEISINDPGGYIRTGVITNTMGRQVFNSGSGLLDGKWHQVALTYDGTNLDSFIDGVMTATHPVSGNLSGTAGEIGRYLSNSYVANGSISDVRIYNRALSADEIKTLYDSYRPKVVSSSLRKGLVLDMPLTTNYTKTETAGSQIMTDETPYSNDGQNYGATVGVDSTSFNGTSNYVGVSNLGAFPPKGTIDFWMNPSVIESYRNPFTTKYLGGNAGIRFEENSVGNFVAVIGNDAGTYLAHAYLSTGLLANTWYHVVLTWDTTSNTVIGYLNGVQKFNGTQTLWPTAIPSVAVGNGFNSSRYWDGQISNVRIYNRVLSGTEVQELYDQGR